MPRRRDPQIVAEGATTGAAAAVPAGRLARRRAGTDLVARPEPGRAWPLQWAHREWTRQRHEWARTQPDEPAAWHALHGEITGERVWRDASAARYELVLPWRTPPLSLNDRHSWPVRARKVAEVRQTTGWLARAARIGVHERIRVQLLYVPAVHRTRDSDNLVATMKPAVDGLVDAGVVADDNDQHVVRGWPEIRAVDPSRAGLVLLVEPLTGAGRGAHCRGRCGRGSRGASTRSRHRIPRSVSHTFTAPMPSVSPTRYSADRTATSRGQSSRSTASRSGDTRSSSSASSSSLLSWRPCPARARSSCAPADQVRNLRRFPATVTSSSRHARNALLFIGVDHLAEQTDDRERLVRRDPTLL